VRQIIAALAVVSLSAGCTPTPSVSTGTATARPTADTGPSPIATPLDVPASVPVIMFHDPAKYDQVDGVTWDAAKIGRVAATGGRSGFVPNPAGTFFAAEWNRAIYDRSGRLADSNPFAGLGGFGTWADDGRHYCQMQGTTLVLGAVGEQARTIVNQAPERATSTVAACSVLKDRAVLFGYLSSGHPTLWVIRLSTGGVLWTRSYPVPQMHPDLDIVASPDGQFIAENRWNFGGAPSMLVTATVTSVDGARLALIAGEIRHFSWDGTLAVVDNNPGTPPSAGGTPSVIRWGDGHVLWKAPDGRGYYNALPEPGGSHIAIALAIRADPTPYGWVPREDVFIVGGDGSVAAQLQTTAVAFPACPYYWVTPCEPAEIRSIP